MPLSQQEDSVLPATKRRRVQEELLVKADDTLYFANGNIVLLSLPQDDLVTAFKVYKDYLVLNSPVFEDMFRVPQPCDGVEEYENTPLVRLHDEIAHLAPFLRAIYDPTALPSKRDFYLSLDKVEGVFKLSKKYQCDKLLQHMQDTLLEVWPTDLRSWDLMDEKEYALLLLGEDEWRTREHAGQSALPDPYAAARLAQEYNVPAVLPVVYYDLVRRSFTDATSPPGVIEDFTVDHRGLICLSQDDLCRVVRGSHAIRVFFARLFRTARRVAVRKVESTHNDSRGDESRSSYDCHTAILRVIGRHQSLLFEERDMLRCLKETFIRSSKPERYKSCQMCLTWYITYMDEHRLKFWDALPVFFGLDASARESGDGQREILEVSCG